METCGKDCNKMESGLQLKRKNETKATQRKMSILGKDPGDFSRINMYPHERDDTVNVRA